MILYRSLKESEYNAFNRMINYAFALPEGEQKNKKKEEKKYLGELRGLFEDNMLLTCFQLYSMDIKIRNEWLLAGGIGVVASPPENRRKGFVAKMFKEALQEMRERGMVISVLWPFSYPFYRRLGWEMASAFRRYKLKPEKLKFTHNYVEGEYRRITGEEYPLLDEVYRGFYSKYDLETKRNKDWWQERVIRTGKKERYVYLYEKEGQPLGYLIYDGEEGKDNYWDFRLKIHELKAVDFKSYMQLLRFISYHQDQVKEVDFFAPLNDPLVKILPDPNVEKNEYRPGAMIRIVDLCSLFSKLAYPSDLDFTFTLTVFDKQAEWNNGNFEVKIKEGQAECKPITHDCQTDITLDINQLAPLITGFSSFKEIIFCHGIEVKDNNLITKLEKAFPLRSSFFMESF